MTTTGISTERARWQVRLTRVHDRLVETVAAFQDGEFDWAPDVGIEDARSILWHLARRERCLVRLLENRVDDIRPGGARVDVGEILSLLEATLGRLTAWIEEATEDDLHHILDREMTVDDHLCEHLLGFTEGIARIRSLVQLIDPARQLPAPVAAALP